jgi:hypothetical protein
LRKLCIGRLPGVSVKVQLLRVERDLILKYGYPFERLEQALKRWPSNADIRRVSITDYELELLIGELSRSINHRQAGKEEEDELIDLCDRLEYVERTGDGDLDILI